MNFVSIKSKIKSLFKKHEVKNYESYPIYIREFFDITLGGNWGLRIQDKGGTMITFVATNSSCTFGYTYNDGEAEVTKLHTPYKVTGQSPPPEIILVNSKIIFMYMNEKIPYFHKDNPAPLR